ncbi:DUF1918 domain-containing protein [Haloechinothrix salitolerans]|uniref:DUF1918 domain-containing protein n=1 Tax=Haloechinothrix salitolerans TaxID=926830 RepID=A0ABW2BUP4_9PSEU
MRAERGDWLIIERASVDQAPRKGVILDVGTPDGLPPFLVRWGGNGYTSLVVPGPDARIVKRAAASRQRRRTQRRVPRWWRRLTVRG